MTPPGEACHLHSARALALHTEPTPPPPCPPLQERVPGRGHPPSTAHPLLRQATLNQTIHHRQIQDIQTDQSMAVQIVLPQQLLHPVPEDGGQVLLAMIQDHLSLSMADL